MEKSHKTNEHYQDVPQATPPHQPPTMTQQYGNTTYDIHIHFNPNATQTFSDKVLKLIKNDTKANKIS